ncbi:MAG: 3-phosphoshikimate 1-carboxyvinyltransferase [Candidatus Bathyarchaeia archaeon]
MRIKVRKSEIRGRASAPPSKSYTHRALLCSALADGKSTIISPLVSDDTEATAELLEKLGVGITRGSKAWRVEGGAFHEPDGNLYCRDSGTTLRFMTAFCTMVDGKSRLTAGPSLSKRPIGPLVGGLNQLGAHCSSQEGFPPVVVRGKGRLRGGVAKIPGDISSQFVSAMLLVAPLTEEGVMIRLTTPLQSKPYVSMTIDAQRHFKVDAVAPPGMEEFFIRKQRYEPTTYSVEGDWSSAAYLLASAALAGRVEVEGLNTSSSQADVKIVEVLRMMGAKVSDRKESVTVERSRLTGVEVDVSDQPDLFPVVSVLCAAAEGRSLIHGTRRLRLKESDRLATMVEGLGRMEVKTDKMGDTLLIEGMAPRGGVIDPRKDHRIAMAFGVLGLAAEGDTTILDAECVSKSYPGFWATMETLGANIRRL